jgi:heptosyltransferase-1
VKILIVKTSALGDVIHAFTALQLLREKYPDAQIDWVVEQPLVELVQAHPFVNQVFSVQTKQWRKNFWRKEGWQAIQAFRRELQKKSYDIVYDLQGNTKSGLITWLANGAVKVGFGWDTVPEWPNLLFTNRRFNPPLGKNIREDYLYLIQQTDLPSIERGSVSRLKITPQEQAKLDQILHHPFLQRGKKIMVCPGSIWTNKQMTEASLTAFLQKIDQSLNPSFLLVWGSEAERAVVQNMALAFPGRCLVVDRLALPTLQNLMAQVDLVIAMDSLPLHLAGTTSTPTYGVFGASSAAKYKPIGSQAYQGACPYGKTFEKRCPILRTCPTGSCIKDIPIDPLFEDFQAWYIRFKTMSST